MKTCTKCGVEKELGEFSKNKREHDGLNGLCRICSAEKSREYREANGEKVLEAGRKWRRENPDKVRENNREQYTKDLEKSRKRGRDDYAKDPERARQRSRERHERIGRFACALEDSRSTSKKGNYEPCNATVEEIEVAFNGKCHLCGVPELECKKKLHMDHCHVTGDFRGWLCFLCNNMLGLARDSEDILINALHYVMNCKEKARK